MSFGSCDSIDIVRSEGGFSMESSLGQCLKQMFSLKGKDSIGLSSHRSRLQKVAGKCEGTVERQGHVCHVKCHLENMVSYKDLKPGRGFHS